MKKTRILFVCMGNICRSPSAEGVMRKLIKDAGLQDVIEVDSAGTHAEYHLGEPADARSQEVAKAHGYDLAGMRARQVDASDFTDFDLLLAMDMSNMKLLRHWCPRHLRSKLQLMMHYADKPEAAEVPDPYNQGMYGFEVVLDYLEDACKGLLRQLQDSYRYAALSKDAC